MLELTKLLSAVFACCLRVLMYQSFLFSANLMFKHHFSSYTVKMFHSNEYISHSILFCFVYTNFLKINLTGNASNFDTCIAHDHHLGFLKPGSHLSVK